MGLLSLPNEVLFLIFSDISIVHKVATLNRRTRDIVNDPTFLQKLGNTPPSADEVVREVAYRWRFEQPDAEIFFLKMGQKKKISQCEVYFWSPPEIGFNTQRVKKKKGRLVIKTREEQEDSDDDLPGPRPRQSHLGVAEKRVRRLLLTGYKFVSSAALYNIYCRRIWLNLKVPGYSIYRTYRQLEENFTLAENYVVPRYPGSIRVFILLVTSLTTGFIREFKYQVNDYIYYTEDPRLTDDRFDQIYDLYLESKVQILYRLPSILLKATKKGY